MAKMLISLGAFVAGVHTFSHTNLNSTCNEAWAIEEGWAFVRDVALCVDRIEQANQIASQVADAKQPLIDFLHSYHGKADGEGGVLIDVAVNTPYTWGFMLPPAEKQFSDVSDFANALEIFWHPTLDFGHVLQAKTHEPGTDGFYELFGGWWNEEKQQGRTGILQLDTLTVNSRQVDVQDIALTTFEEEEQKPHSHKKHFVSMLIRVEGMDRKVAVRCGYAETGMVGPSIQYTPGAPRCATSAQPAGIVRVSDVAQCADTLQRVARESIGEDVGDVQRAVARALEKCRA